MGIKITRLGATFNPPSISIEYQENSKQLKYRQFPVVFASFSDPNAVYQTLVSDYPEFFNSKTILERKLKKFVQLIVSKAPSIDITATSREVIDQFKHIMDKEFESHAIKPGDPEYKYDVQEEYNPVEPSEWDD